MHLKGKYSVSALTHGFSRIEEDIESPRLFAPPSENANKGAGGTDAGTAFHRAMEKLDFKRIPLAGSDGEREGEFEELAAFADAELSRMVKCRYITSEQRESIDVRLLIRFLSSPLCARMKKAADKGKLKRESRFVMEVPASDIDPSVKSSEPVLIQGVADAWFTERSSTLPETDEIILVDYKTDRVPYREAEQVLKKRYSGQLGMYGSALSRASGLKVGECLIYSLFTGLEIRIDPHEIAD